MTNWRDDALAEIRSIKEYWIDKFGWNPTHVEKDDCIDLYVRFGIGSSDGPAKEMHVLRLRYDSDYLTAGRREAFVDPQNHENADVRFWPKGIKGINPKPQRPTICLEGTWGFHSHHHRDRDGRAARINRLLMELQQCLSS